MSLILTSEEAETERKQLVSAYYQTPWGRKELEKKYVPKNTREKR